MGSPGAKHLKDEKDFVADIGRGKLPPVAFFKPIGEDNEHPGYANILKGEAHTASLIDPTAAGLGELFVLRAGAAGDFRGDAPASFGRAALVPVDGAAVAMPAPNSDGAPGRVARGRDPVLRACWRRRAYSLPAGVFGAAKTPGASWRGVAAATTGAPAAASTRLAARRAANVRIEGKLAPIVRRRAGRRPRRSATGRAD